jgi:hypothetical protein
MRQPLGCPGPPPLCIPSHLIGILAYMFKWISTRTWAALALCLGAAVCSGCGTSTEGSRYLMRHGVSDSGYPPKGSGDPETPSVSSMGADVDEKGIEGEPVKTAPQNIPSNLATRPRT